MTRFNSEPSPTMVRKPTMLFVETRAVDDATVGEERVVYGRAIDFGTGQIPRAAENRRVHVKEIDRGNSEARSRFASKNLRIVPMSSNNREK